MGVKGKDGTELKIPVSRGVHKSLKKLAIDKNTSLYKLCINILTEYISKEERKK